MTLQQLRYFLAACRHGSFTAAADSLFIAQPSLAEQVRRLEQEVGIRLFVRTGRKLALTEAGSTLRVHAERVIAAVEVAESSLKVERDLEGGTASLGTFGVAYHYLVKEVVTMFVARHPSVRVRVIGHHTLDVVNMIRDGDLEAGLICLPIDEPTLEVEPVMSDEVLYAVPESAGLNSPITPGALSEHRFIAWEGSAGWRDSIFGHLQAWAATEGFTLKAGIDVEHVESALALAAQGLGATCVPQHIADSADFPDGLVALPFAHPLYDTFAFTWRKGHKLSPATAELIRLGRRHMESFGRPVMPPQGDGSRDLLTPPAPPS